MQGSPGFPGEGLQGPKVSSRTSWFTTTCMQPFIYHLFKGEVYLRIVYLLKTHSKQIGGIILKTQLNAANCYCSQLGIQLAVRAGSSKCCDRMGLAGQHAKDALQHNTQMSLHQSCFPSHSIDHFSLERFQPEFLRDVRGLTFPKQSQTSSKQRDTINTHLKVLLYL